MECSRVFPFAKQAHQVWAEHQEVVSPQVDDERDNTDRAELEHLAHEDVPAARSTVKWQESFCGHETSLAAGLAIPGPAGCQPPLVEPKKVC